ncbi:lipocalin-like domain-containing protein [candidate division KSB1 bacterium]|nr:lipocalin-like domain-containing protein [candidate division KSB1 bacterium]NIR70981.1 lipocalin-like domain-containing protein [candidate division KSB1 bacterium]NIS24722.1 lipocalin-like domain-containing protein [candidate division KSB1 bacterium]NIT71626.1 lipocalin-like domain-containing protein [candidate division KSB1 bacterium]NIU25333.1 lipocalin-like domain-containing protein [candidate division KSB1 bacterium]
MRFALLFCGLLALVSHAYAQEKSNAAEPGSPIEGVWEYLLDESEGFAIYSKHHFTWILTEKNRKGFVGSEPTDAEKAEAYSTLITGAGTYTFHDSVITVKLLYSGNPEEIGSSFSFIFKAEGDIGKYQVLFPDGNKGPVGMLRRLE